MTFTNHAPRDYRRKSTKRIRRALVDMMLAIMMLVVMGWLNGGYR